MRNKTNAQALYATLACLAPVFLGFALYGKLPAQLPIHFDINGVADSYAPKAVACFLLPLGLAFGNLVVHFILNADPKKNNANVVIRSIGLWAIPACSIVFIPITIFKGLGYDIPITMICSALVGLLILVIGNYMPKSRRSYTVGIRLPWTLDSEENWNKTHRFSGFVWVLGGLAILVDAFIGSLWMMLVIMAVLTMIPVIYSYLYYRLHNNEKENPK